MTEEAQRIVIAEALGWTHPSLTTQTGRMHPPDSDRLTIYGEKVPGWLVEPPDYLHDLNACHEMEKLLPLNDEAYMRALRRVTLRDAELGTDLCWRLIRATAPQRAEAFLKALGKWVDGK